MAQAASRTPYALDDIVDIAVGVFLERGYDGATMEDIARAAGITKGSIYYHVSGKEDLLRHGVTRALDALFAVLDEPEARTGTATSRLQHIFRRTVEIVCERTPEVALLVRLLGSSETHQLALERRREFDRSVIRLVKRAIRAGEIDARLDPQVFTRLSLGMAVSIVEWYRPEGKVAAAQLTDHVVQLVFDGCLARS